MDNELAEIFFLGLSELKLKLTAPQVLKFDAYLEELLLWNTRLNLIGPATAEQVIVRHFLDSLSAAEVVRKAHGGCLGGCRMADVGTGAGFPGLPLKIMMPEIALTLVESINKKTEFLRHLCKKIDIEAEILNERAENVAIKSTSGREFDLIVARAVAKPHELKKLCYPMLKKGGHLVLHVSSKTADELADPDVTVKIVIPAKILPGRSVIALKKKS